MEVPQIGAVIAIALVTVTVASVKVIAYDIIVIATKVQVVVESFIVATAWCW